jgi:hypothetical protein
MMMMMMKKKKEEEEDEYNSQTRGGIQDIPDWCHHLYSSCGSTKNLSQLAKL